MAKTLQQWLHWQENLHPVEIDLVLPVPDSGVPAAIGYSEEIKSNDIRKVPMLGDLPVIGNLFKKTAQKTVKRELLIFVTPKILR